MRFFCFISLFACLVGVSSGETNQVESTGWITLSPGVSYRKLSVEENEAYLRELEERHRLNGVKLEPYVRQFETNTQALCSQLLQLVTAYQIRPATEKMGEILSGNPTRNPPKGLRGGGFPDEVYNRCDTVGIQILWCFHRVLLAARKLDLNKASRILIEEKSFDDWSAVFYPTEKEKQKEEQFREARSAALDRLDSLIYSLECELGRLEDQIGSRLQRLKESNLSDEYSRFVSEIKRVVKDPELQEEVLRAEQFPLGCYFLKRSKAAFAESRHKEKIEADRQY